MKPIQVVWLICLFLYSGTDPVQVQIRLRHSDGTAASGETVILERLPALRQAQGDALRQAQGDACTTDAAGACTWPVTPGLYQVLFTRPLDDLSALAVAEGGLDGFGLTVGDSDITYHLTFDGDGRVYFDAAPEATVPSPIIPEPGDLHVPVVPTEPYPAEATTSPPASVSVANTQAAAPDSARRLLVFIGRGLALGVTFHFLRPLLGRVWFRVNLAQKRPEMLEEDKDA